TGGHQDLTVQVLNFHSWTFFFGITCILGLYSLYRLSFVEEPAGRLVLRDLLLEARRSAHSLSSAAGLLRIAQMPQWFCVQVGSAVQSKMTAQNATPANVLGWHWTFHRLEAEAALKAIDWFGLKDLYDIRAGRVGDFERV
ncbi:MAG: hypothetical protein WBX25_13755, partial [Rhodomicrobium sp.]